MSATIVDTDNQVANSLRKLKETRQRLQEQKSEFEIKVLTVDEKAQQFTANAETMNSLNPSKLVNQYKARKSTGKKGRLEKKIVKLEVYNFGIENQITLLEGRAKAEQESAFDASPTRGTEGRRKSGEDPVFDESPRTPVFDELPTRGFHAVLKNADKELTMKPDELKKTIYEINKKIEYMKLTAAQRYIWHCKNMFKVFFTCNSL